MTKNQKVIGIVALLAGIAAFVWWKFFKNKPASKKAYVDIGGLQDGNGNPAPPMPDDIYGYNDVHGNIPLDEGMTHPYIKPIRPVIIPEIPKTDVDGNPVPPHVLTDPNYVKAWNDFYANTQFPSGDPRNVIAPGGGMVIGDGNGGLWNPNGGGLPTHDENGNVINW